MRANSLPAVLVLASLLGGVLALAAPAQAQTFVCQGIWNDTGKTCTGKTCTLDGSWCCTGIYHASWGWCDGTTMVTGGQGPSGGCSVDPNALLIACHTVAGTDDGTGAAVTIDASAKALPACATPQRAVSAAGACGHP
jgi:hypothetical protein